jgi:hypothetical protein
LDDIISISEDKDTFSVETASRIMVIQAQTRAEHRLWLQGIAERAPNATLRNITTGRLHICVILRTIVDENK